MKFTVKKTVIVDALSSALGVVEKRQAIPILSNVLINVEEDGIISLTATDTESEIRTTFQASVETGGKTTAPANKLGELCRLLPEGADISIYLNGDKLFIESGSGKYSISTLPSDDFPAFGSDDNGVEIKIPAVTLKNLINKTFFAIDNTVSWKRPALRGLFIEIGGENITAVSTDAHRLATTSSLLKTGLEGEVSGIIPRKAVSEIGKLLSDLTDDVSVFLSSNTVKLQTSHFSFSSKLVAQKFPNYEHTFPSGESDVLKINTKTFSDAVRRVKVLSDYNEKPILLQVKSNQILISTAGRNKEEAEESLNIEYNGEAFEIAFKSNYLQDIFSTIDSEECFFNFFGNDKNCLVTSPEDPNFKCILMPLLLT
tara:strand:- start:1032 stop:2144 length:1113 start_codon:yes stop_codon:yes gene_type:complete